MTLKAMNILWRYWELIISEVVDAPHIWAMKRWEWSLSDEETSASYDGRGQSKSREAWVMITLNSHLVHNLWDLYRQVVSQWLFESDRFEYHSSVHILFVFDNHWSYLWKPLSLWDELVFMISHRYDLHLKDLHLNSHVHFVFWVGASSQVINFGS